MAEQEKELINRYIYAVTCKLPKEQRQEVAMELEEMINDMYESGKGSIEEVLRQLGSPKEMAKKYCNTNNYLIGPEYISTYWWVVKIALICNGLTTLLSEIYDTAFHSNNIYENIVNLITNLCENLIGTFGVITVIFIIIEYAQTKSDTAMGSDPVLNSYHTNQQNAKSNEWNPSSLKPVLIKKATISRGDSIVGLIVTMIIGTLLIAKPSFFSAYLSIGNKEYTKIPFFNLDIWECVIPFIAVYIILNAIDLIVKVVSGQYCKTVWVTNVFVNVLKLLLLTIVVKTQNVFNPDFADALAKHENIKSYSKGDILYYWGTDRINNIIIVVALICVIVEVAVTSYRTIKYAQMDN